MLGFYAGVAVGLIIAALATKASRNLYRGVAFSHAADLVRTLRLERLTKGRRANDELAFAERMLRAWSAQPEVREWHMN